GRQITTDNLDPWPERGCPLPFITASPQHLHGLVAGRRCQLLQHAGLAHAWFALQEDQLPLATAGGCKGCLQDGHFPCAADPALGCRGRRDRKTRQDAKVLLLHTVVPSTRMSG